MKQKYVVVSLSGGKDSTAMLLRMIELGEHIDEVVCCDTYKEFPAMYRHLAKLKAVVEQNGIKYTELRNKESYDYLMFEKPRPNDKPIGRGWATFKIRWCTTELKKEVTRKYIKNLEEKHEIIQCLGIAFDEQYRLKRKNNQDERHRHPLVEWQWTEEMCLKYCYSKGYDWEGLYEIFDRVSCWCCPLKSFDELRKLRKHFHDLWDELQDMDCRANNRFKPDYSVAELEKRFAFEEERISQGLSITNRDFYAELKKVLMQ